MSTLRNITIIALIALVYTSCHKNNKKSTVTNSVYCWDNREFYHYFSDNETKAIFDNEIKKIYCKIADVVWNKTYHAEPINKNNFPDKQTIFSYAELIPCMFFTNEVMIKSTKDELDYMAKKIALRIHNYKVKEFQLDCDWSETSKENYFYFIKSLRKSLDSNINISATIRLYQYKYPEKTGVPPVDRGMLMLYNFNSPKKYDGKNAIFDFEEAKKYIVEKKYPLPLDFAVAHYKWNALYDMNNSFIGFVNQEDANELIKQADASKNKEVYTLKSDVSITGYFARKGQKLVVYQTNNTTLRQSLELIKELENTDKYALAIFDLNENTSNYLLSNESIFKISNIK